MFDENYINDKPGRMPENRVIELAAMRVPLLSAFEGGKVVVAGTCNPSNNSHCCMSLVISWKDTTCGCKVIDRFRKISVAWDGSLEE